MPSIIRRRITAYRGRQARHRARIDREQRDRRQRSQWLSLNAIEKHYLTSVLQQLTANLNAIACLMIVMVKLSDLLVIQHPEPHSVLVPTQQRRFRDTTVSLMTYYSERLEQHMAVITDSLYHLLRHRADWNTAVSGYQVLLAAAALVENLHEQRLIFMCEFRLGFEMFINRGRKEPAVNHYRDLFVEKAHELDGLQPLWQQELRRHDALVNTNTRLG